ncbi:MAG: hypothetical protein B6U76_10360 [Desulfurococcales archaeon ex4484_217_2]|nr:MAG: hypothetical protein B6U76_10360 [Desulfurococcales archaeon ex4484_217_2]
MNEYSIVFALPEFSFDDYINDMIIAIPAAALIGITIFLTRRIKNPWFNRKIIHLSSVPAVFMYLYVFKEPYAFFTYGTLITVLLVLHHLRKNEMSWFQIRGNLGEVYYTVSYSVMALTMWYMRELAVTVMLFMAVGDAVTGLVRIRVCRERCKHWIGSLAMLITTSIIGYVFLGSLGLLMAIIATIAERQEFIDDNLGIPLASILTYLLVTSLVTI